MRDKFINGKWNTEIDVRDFIQKNYTPYDGDESFLTSPTEKTVQLWNKVKNLMEEERKNGGVLDIDTRTISTITSVKKGYNAFWRYQNVKKCIKSI